MTDGPAVDTRPTKIMYVAEATAHGGREGYVTSQDGQLDLKVAMPPQLGGDGNGTNPEQLFAAGYSACFHNALILVGNREGYDLAGSTVAAKVGIGAMTRRFAKRVPELGSSTGSNRGGPLTPSSVGRAQPDQHLLVARLDLVLERAIQIDDGTSDRRVQLELRVADLLHAALLHGYGAGAVGNPLNDPLQVDD